MSLFKTRELWTTDLGDLDQFDSDSLLVTNLNEDHESILLGSHEGMFRVYNPLSTNDGTTSGFIPSDLLLEVQLSQPILQMSFGAFVSGSNFNHIGILHPKLFSVYAVTRIPHDTDDVGEEISLQLIYQHQLRRSAYSFISGHFGGVQNRDFVCIQSLDGMLSFYEQESFTFSLFIPEYLLPSPFAYLPKTDSFVWMNAMMHLDCYSYETLASVGHTSDDISTSKKKITKLWTHNVGETAYTLKTVTTGEKTNLLMLTNHHLYNFNENGGVIFCKRFDFKPICCHSYLLRDNIVTIIATDTQNLNIYENVDLKWSTKLDFLPVAICRIFTKAIKGGVCLLTENGYLTVSYLGTHPSLFVIPPMMKQEINVSQAENELKDIQRKILENDTHTFTSDVQDVLIKIGVVKVEDNFGTIVVNLIPQSPLNKVQVLFNVEPPLFVSKKSSVISSLCDKTDILATIQVAAGQVSSLKVEVAVSYNVNGMPKVYTEEIILPLKMILVTCPPPKEAKYKITVNTNKPVINLNQIFNEFGAETTNVLGLKYTNTGVVVAVLAAKTSQRYRLQSDNLEAIYVVLAAVIKRLKQFFQKVTDFNLNYSSNLYLQTYFDYIEKYHKLIKDKRIVSEKLSKQTAQYRMIEKKLLINLKEVTPKPLTNLNNILKDTYMMISATCRHYETTQGELDQMKMIITALSRLLLSLLGLMTISTEDMDYVKIVFNPYIHEASDHGWLEVQEASISHLLRTKLAKSEKDRQKAKDITLEPLADTVKLSKHIISALDRVTKGTHLLERNEFEPEADAEAVLPEAEDQPRSNELVPIGSKLADMRDSAIPPKLVPLLPGRRKLSDVEPSSLSEELPKSPSHTTLGRKLGLKELMLKSPEKQQNNVLIEEPANTPHLSPIKETEKIPQITLSPHPKEMSTLKRSVSPLPKEILTLKRSVSPIINDTNITDEQVNELSYDDLKTEEETPASKETLSQMNNGEKKDSVWNNEPIPPPPKFSSKKQEENIEDDDIWDVKTEEMDI